MTSFELFRAFYKLNLLDKNEPNWWHGFGTFEVILGSILTQQSKWQNVLNAIENMKKAGLNSPEKIAKTDEQTLQPLIKQTGFYRQKSERIIMFCNNLINDFGSFEGFVRSVSLNWLLSQKGIGQESADSILNYACFVPTMVVDSYTFRVLSALDFSFETYQEAKEWLEYGIFAKEKDLEKMGFDLVRAFNVFHGMFVEFSKQKNDIKILKNTLELL